MSQKNVLCAALALLLFGPLASALAIPSNAITNNINDGKDKGCNTKCKSCSGSPIAWVTEPWINAWISDEPVSYLTSRGEPFTFRITYKQRDTRPAKNTYEQNIVANTGWNNSWSSFIHVNFTVQGACAPNANFYLSGCTAAVYLPDGGEVDFEPGQSYDPETRLMLLQQMPGQPLAEGSDNGASGLRLVHADGSQDIYGFCTPVFSPPTGQPCQADFLRTRHIDANGDTTWFGWGGTPYAVRSVVDPDGLTNTLSYTSAYFVLASVTNAYGLSAQFQYDTNYNLIKITDAQGLSSSITWDTNGFPTSLVTPYGTNVFSILQNISPGSQYANTNGNFGGSNLIDRAVQVTDPIGATSLYLYRYDCSLDTPLNMATNFPASDVPTNTPLGTLDTGTGTGTNFLGSICYRNSFYWSPRQYLALSTTSISNLTAGDYLLARMRHWLQDTNSLYVSEDLSVERDFSPDGVTEGLKTFYDYQGKAFPWQAGTNPLPSVVAWRLPNGETHYIYALYDYFGNITNFGTTYTQTNGSVGTRSFFAVYSNNTYSNNWNGVLGTSFTVPNLLTKIIGPDGNPIWSFAGFDTVTWTNYFNGYNPVTGTQSNSTTMTSTRLWPDFLTNGSGQLATATYTSTGQAVTCPAVGTTFPGVSKLLSFKSVGGLTTTNLYATNGFLLQTADVEIGRSNSFGYTANGLIGAFTNELGLNLAVTWDNLLRPTLLGFPDGTWVSNRFDKLDLAGRQDREGHFTFFGHDAGQNLTWITNADTNVTQLVRCTCGALAGIIDPLTNATSLFYDNQGNLTNIAYADGSSQYFQWNLARQLVGISDGAGRSISASYNNQGLVSSISSAAGLLRSVIYDIRDRPAIVTDANSITVTNSFDLLDRINVRVWPDGVAEGLGYSPQGLAFYTNRDGKVTQYARNPAGWLTTLTNANLETNQVSYNPAGQVIGLVDGLAHTASWQYNQYGWLVGKTNALGSNVLRLAYYPTGWLSNRWTPEKGNTFYTWDNVGNLKTVVYPQTNISFVYDPDNRLTNMVDNLGTNVFTYTQAGQLASETGPWANSTISYTYSQGLRTGLAIAQPSGGSWSQSYNYDLAWRLTNTASPAGSFIYSYQAPISYLPSSISLPNGAGIANSYDSLARLRFTALNNYWGHTLDGYAYTPDPLGLRTNITRMFGLGTNSVAVGYDNIGQLTSWVASETNGTARQNEQLSFAFDAAHNLHIRTNGALVQTFNCDAANELTSISRSGHLTLSGSLPAPATNLTVNGQAAQLYGDMTFARTNLALSDGNNTFTNIARNIYGLAVTNISTFNLPSSVAPLYDLNGSLTNDGLRSFAYDSEDQLTNVTVAGAWKTDFIHDGLRRLRIERDYGWQSGAWTQTNELHFLYVGFLLTQVRDANNNVLWTLTRGSDLSGSLAGAGGIGGLLARTDGSGSTFYHADGAGNVTALMDGSENVAARYLHGPFGKLLSERGSLAGVNAIGFSSMPSYTHAGLLGYWGRLYDPNLQRWLNTDPIGEAGGANLYGFVYNNPLLYADPDGTQVETVAAVAATVTASSGGAGTTITVVGGGAAAVGGTSAGAVAAPLLVIPVAAAAALMVANTPPSPVTYPGLAGGGNPIPSQITTQLGYVLGPGEYRDQQGNIRDAQGNLVRDKLGRPVPQLRQTNPTAKQRAPCKVTIAPGTGLPSNSLGGTVYYGGYDPAKNELYLGDMGHAGGMDQAGGTPLPGVTAGISVAQTPSGIIWANDSITLGQPVLTPEQASQIQSGIQNMFPGTPVTRAQVVR